MRMLFFFRITHSLSRILYEFNIDSYNLMIDGKKKSVLFLFCMICMITMTRQSTQLFCIP